MDWRVADFDVKFPLLPPYRHGSGRRGSGVHQDIAWRLRSRKNARLSVIQLGCESSRLLLNSCGAILIAS